MSAEHPRLVSRKNVPTYAPMSKQLEDDEEDDEDEVENLLPLPTEDVDNGWNCHNCFSFEGDAIALMFVTLICPPFVCVPFTWPMLCTAKGNKVIDCERSLFCCFDSTVCCR